MGFFKQVGNFLTGTPEKHKRVSNLLPEQQQLYDQLVGAGMGEGAGGAFGDAADYYRNLLSDNPEDLQAFAAPEMRRFNEEIIPGLSEQFAGMGSGGLSSSGFRNAAVNAGTDLSERLGSLRAQLRQQGAQGLAGIGQAGLGNYSQDVMTQPGSQGLLGSISQGVGNAIGQFGGNYFGGTSIGKNTNPYGTPEQQAGSNLLYQAQNIRG